MSKLLEKYNIKESNEFIVPSTPEGYNRYGFSTLTKGMDYTSQCEMITSSQKLKEETRTIKWKKMLEQWKYDGKIPKKLKRRVYKGVPVECRKEYWSLISKSFQSKQQGNENLNNLFFSTKEINDDNQIDLDVKRTLGYHYLFKDNYVMGKRELFLILRALSQEIPEVGYTQGMSDLAGIIFSIVLQRNDTFDLMNTMITNERYNLQSCLKTGFPGLIRCEKIHNMLLKNIHHSIYNHLISLGYEEVQCPGFLFEWYMVWFCRILPCDFCYAIIDLCLLYGQQAIYTIASTLLHYLKKDLLSCEDISSALQILKNPSKSLLSYTKCSQFIRQCYKYRIKSQTISDWMNA
ncbi:hypothetical protein ENUP19_0009G0056 [Entamoeba nuttalli]|uniref:TBC domain containing protein n=2 Tax=Entamoeba nuttalli TaxID=412467 RepID=K2HS33_ENTNP|nr:TBC domain containing protein [Entamoeba nuttalli P19]EKE38865.1 TBC domain containing protein [Entamoeba nuttalli P19]|eukprot:XP_008858801.1 TBC domain containing protein [Entamoeba nuttalli P19]